MSFSGPETGERTHQYGLTETSFFHCGRAPKNGPVAPATSAPVWSYGAILGTVSSSATLNCGPAPILGDRQVNRQRPQDRGMSGPWRLDAEEPPLPNFVGVKTSPTVQRGSLRQSNSSRRHLLFEAVSVTLHAALDQPGASFSPGRVVNIFLAPSSAYRTRPRSPLRAASTDALSARIFVWKRIVNDAIISARFFQHFGAITGNRDQLRRCICFRSIVCSRIPACASSVARRGIPTCSLHADAHLHVLRPFAGVMGRLLLGARSQLFIFSRNLLNRGVTTEQSTFHVADNTRQTKVYGIQRIESSPTFTTFASSQFNCCIFEKVIAPVSSTLRNTDLKITVLRPTINSKPMTINTI